VDDVESILDGFDDVEADCLSERFLCQLISLANLEGYDVVFHNQQWSVARNGGSRSGSNWRSACGFILMVVEKLLSISLRIL